MDWKKIVREVRRSRGWTKVQLAEYLGVSRISVASWERGVYMPNRDSAIKLQKMYEEEVGE